MFLELRLITKLVLIHDPIARLNRCRELELDQDVLSGLRFKQRPGLVRVLGGRLYQCSAGDVLEETPCRACRGLAAALDRLSPHSEPMQTIGWLLQLHAEARSTGSGVSSEALYPAGSAEVAVAGTATAVAEQGDNRAEERPTGDLAPVSATQWPVMHRPYDGNVWVRWLNWVMKHNLSPGRARAMFSEVLGFGVGHSGPTPTAPGPAQTAHMARVMTFRENVASGNLLRGLLMLHLRADGTPAQTFQLVSFILSGFDGEKTITRLLALRRVVSKHGAVSARVVHELMGARPYRICCLNIVTVGGDAATDIDTLAAAQEEYKQADMDACFSAVEELGLFPHLAEAAGVCLAEGEQEALAKLRNRWYRSRPVTYKQGARDLYLVVDLESVVCDGCADDVSGGGYLDLGSSDVLCLACFDRVWNPSERRLACCRVYRWADVLHNINNLAKYRTIEGGGMGQLGLFRDSKHCRFVMKHVFSVCNSMERINWKKIRVLLTAVTGIKRPKKLQTYTHRFLNVTRGPLFNYLSSRCDPHARPSPLPSPLLLHHLPAPLHHPNYSDAAATP